MKMKNRKGSTLVMTLLIFVVLMIFGTVTLNLMVNENKQSLNHQYKTQAYYIARSGVVAVESALESVIKDMDVEGLKDLYNNIKEDGTEVEINGKVAIVKIIKEKNEDSQKYLYTIVSEGRSNGVKEKVEKVIAIEIKETKGEKWTITSSLTYIESSDDILITKNNAKKPGDKDVFPDHIFEDIGNLNNMKLLPSLRDEKIKISAGSYIVDSLSLNNKELEISGGTVNIYVKNFVSLAESSITYYDKNDSCKENLCKLNIYIYGIEKDEGYALKIGSDGYKDKLGKVQANFFVKEGKTRIAAHKLELEGNIISYGNTIDLSSHANGMDIKGIIYGPNATINFGKPTNDPKGNSPPDTSISINGAVIGKTLKYYGKDNHGHLKDLDINLPKSSDTSFDEQNTINIIKSPGYFK